MENKSLREKLEYGICSEVNGDKRSCKPEYCEECSFVLPNLRDAVEANINLIKEELEGLTVSSDNPYFIVERVGMDPETSYNQYPKFRCFEDGKSNQLSHTIQELNERYEI